jgi:hypothetical protein
MNGITSWMGMCKSEIVPIKCAPCRPKKDFSTSVQKCIAIICDTKQ